MEFDDGKSEIKIVFVITKRVHNDSINLTTSSIVILLLLLLY